MSDTATPSNSRHHLTHSTVRVMFPTQHHRVGGGGGGAVLKTTTLILRKLRLLLAKPAAPSQSHADELLPATRKSQSRACNWHKHEAGGPREQTWGDLD